MKACDYRIEHRSSTSKILCLVEMSTLFKLKLGDEGTPSFEMQ